jgi:hypothetical protein
MIIIFAGRVQVQRWLQVGERREDVQPGEHDVLRQRKVRVRQREVHLQAVDLRRVRIIFYLSW